MTNPINIPNPFKSDNLTLNSEKQFFNENHDFVKKQFTPYTQEKRVFKELPLIKVAYLDENIKAKIFKTDDGELIYDLRVYYNDYPTKKGIRLKKQALNKLKDLIKE